MVFLNDFNVFLDRSRTFQKHDNQIGGSLQRDFRDWKWYHEHFREFSWGKLFAEYFKFIGGAHSSLYQNPKIRDFVLYLQKHRFAKNAQ